MEAPLFYTSGGFVFPANPHRSSPTRHFYISVNDTTSHLWKSWHGINNCDKTWSFQHLLQPQLGIYDSFTFVVIAIVKLKDELSRDSEDAQGVILVPMALF